MIMALINNTLNRILSKNNGYCCLCFNKITEEDTIYMEDELVMSENDEHVLMADVLTYILPFKVPQNVATNRMCTKCSKLAVSSYKFVKMCKNNIEVLFNTVETLNASLSCNLEEINNCKTLFVSLDTKNFSSKQYYDKRSKFISNIAAYRKFQTLSYIRKNSRSSSDFGDNMAKVNSDMNPENHFDVPNKVYSKKNKHSLANSISILDILYDGNDLNNCKCKICFQIYPTLYNLKLHFIRVHAPKLFKCPNCPRRYGSACILEQHRHESHTKAVCSHCGKTYNNRHSLKVHEIGHKLHLVCQYCGRQYKQKSTYMKHISLKECNRPRMSPSQAQFTCDICGKKFCQKATLRVHIIFEHGKGKSHECLWCSKKFYALSKLNAHIVKHTKEKKFSCQQCGGRFVTKESLLYHTRIHTGDKPFKCDYCDDRFLSASRRMTHVRRHHVDATIECDVCHSKFKDKSYLIKHKKKHFDLNSKLGNAIASAENVV